MSEIDSVGHLRLSIVMPCLDEAETLARCIEKARAFFRERGISGEIVVADNGSTDGSVELAERLGARVVHVPARGYGSALRGGIAASRGDFVVMGDADDSYDFADLGAFIDRLEEGHDLVVGNRFQGGIRPRAMPALHRWLGNPVLSAIGRLFFRSKLGDFHCGLRAFRRTAYDAMDLRSSGMEFASEMIIKSQLRGLAVCEVPTVLHPDGRSRAPHLRTWRDGWRHLRFMLLFSPRWLFLLPGLALMILGGAMATALLPGSLRVGSVVLDVHTLLVATFAALLGYQLVVFALFTQAFAVREGYRSATDRPGLLGWFRLEVGVAVGLVCVAAGTWLVGSAVWSWSDAAFGDLDPGRTMRQVIPGVAAVTFGVQTIYSSFFLGILGLDRD
jgi:glycosyltransferase involved in cell wall biosynthesis